MLSTYVALESALRRPFIGAPLDGLLDFAESAIGKMGVILVMALGVIILLAGNRGQTNRVPGALITAIIGGALVMAPLAILAISTWVANNAS